MPATGLQVRIVAEAFDPQAEAAAFCAGRDDAGALVTFCGYCRSANKGEAVADLRLDQYEGFTEKEITHITQDVAARFSCLGGRGGRRGGGGRPGGAGGRGAGRGARRAGAGEAGK